MQPGRGRRSSGPRICIALQHMPERGQAQKGKIMRFEQEKMIVGSLPSLYPLQKFEEEAINALVSLPIDDDTISRAKEIYDENSTHNI